ncbi:MAG: tRNA lysidine(34) synthetase TilS [Bacilli bacterium]|nr:tRNA lysidine(34) synthetase TilS [Bacilli bacterium]
MKETVAYLNSLLKDNDKVVVGLSGGPDSMCLLDILLSLNKKIEIICAHINHNIRKESTEEEKFVKDYCSKRKVIYETTTFDKKSPNKDYTEQELREKRYIFFEKIIKKHHAKYLFTAHHGDDLIETILMRISRGSNLKGYTGFQIETPKDGYSIIKPLIFVSKDEINKYNEENNIPFVKDHTNDEDNYTRNRYRHNILPFLKNENKNIHLKYLKFSRELSKYYNYVSKEVEKEINKRYNKGILDISEFTRLDELIQTKIIEYILDDNYIDNLYLVSDKHVLIILDVINNPRPNIELNLPDELRITKSYNKLKVTRNKKDKKSYNIILNDKVELSNGHSVEFLEDTNETSNNYLKLNSKDIKLPLYVRTRKDGDKMTIKNMSSPKKLKDIFIDLKLSKEERDNQPIVVDAAGEILWIPGLKKSKFDKAKQENYDIILRYN